MRDEAARKELEKLGWTVLIIWQCELNDSLELQNRLGNLLGRR